MRGILGLVVAIGLAGQAGADAIRLTAGDFQGLPGGVSGSVDGIDPNAKATTMGSVGQAHLGGLIYLPENAGGQGSARLLINHDFQFELGVKDPVRSLANGPLVFEGPHLLVLGHADGVISGQSVSTNLDGGFRGKVTAAEVVGGTAGEAVPRALLDLIQHPSRISIMGSMIGGPLNMLGVSLVLAPASAVAEPSGVLVFGMMAGLGIWVRMRKLKLKLKGV